MRSAILLLFVPLLLLATAPAAPAQQRAPAGFRTYGNDLAPIRFYYPRTYTEVPLAPTEKVLVARYVMRTAPRELSRDEQRAYAGREAEVYAFYFEEPAVTTPQGTTKSETSEPQEDKGPRNQREALESRSQVSNWTEFRDRRLGAFRVEPVEGEEGHFRLSYPKNKPQEEAVRLGYLVFERVEERHVMGVFGHTLPSHYERMRRDVIRMAWGLDFRKELKKEFHEGQLDRLYEGKDYKGIERRKNVRRELAKGWKALDTENFILVYNTRDEGLVNKIARDIEAMREVYAGIFAATAPIEAVSIVRICRNKTEYHQYGGPPGSGGYWHPGNEELVFFDYDQEQREMSDKDAKDQRRRLTDKDSYLVLYHEAFHQYIHYAIGEFNPHDWFNEGFGDYFSGAIIPQRSREVKEIGPSPWRIHLAKNQCEFRHGFVPLERLLKAERGEFYHPARRGLYYAAAWSFIYFLRNADEVAQNPAWSKLVPTYFEAIQKHYQQELAAHGDDPSLQEKHLASAKARIAALKDATDGIDLKQLEEAWRRFIVEMKDPWPQQRVIPEQFKDEKRR